MKTFLATAVLLTMTGGAALGQYSGPTEGGDPDESYAESTVGAIMADPKDDAKVILEGRLTSKTGDESYVFNDGTGQIRVEIDDDDFPLGSVDETTSIRIEGEVDTHLVKDTDIDAERVTIIGQ